MPPAWSSLSIHCAYSARRFSGISIVPIYSANVPISLSSHIFFQHTTGQGSSHWSRDIIGCVLSCRRHSDKIFYDSAKKPCVPESFEFPYHRNSHFVPILRKIKYENALSRLHSLNASNNLLCCIADVENAAFASNRAEPKIIFALYNVIF